MDKIIFLVKSRAGIYSIPDEQVHDAFMARRDAEKFIYECKQTSTVHRVYEVEEIKLRAMK